MIKIINAACSKGQELELESKTVIHIAFNKFTGVRDKCNQEVNHLVALVAANPMVECSTHLS